MRRILLAMSAVLLPAAMATVISSGPAYARPVPMYQAVELGTLRAPSAVNDRDEVAGIGTAADGETHPFLWRDGTLIDLGTPPGAVRWSGVARDINERGQVVGTVISGGGFLWDRGVMTELRGPDFAVATADAINNLGDVVGTFFPPGGGQNRGYLWQRGTLTDLGEIYPVDINDRGQILAGRGNQACIWQRGRITDLDFVTGVAINNRGWVAGLNVLPDYSAVRAVLWRNGRTTELGNLGGTNDRPTSMNERGQIIGTSVTAGGELHAVLWRNGRTIDLATRGIVIETIPGQASPGGVFDINNLGHITADLALPPDYSGPSVLFR